MTGWFEVLEIVFFVICWFLAVLFLVPRCRGGFS